MEKINEITVQELKPGIKSEKVTFSDMPSLELFLEKAPVTILKKTDKKNKVSKKKKGKKKDKSLDLPVTKPKVKNGEYRVLAQSGYLQPMLPNSYRGYDYQSNLKTNQEMYFNSQGGKESVSLEKEIASHKELESYARETRMQFLMGSSVLDVHPEQKKKIEYALNDPSKKAVYLAIMSLMGLGPGTG